MLGTSWGGRVNMGIFLGHLFYVRICEEKLINGKIIIIL